MRRRKQIGKHLTNAGKIVLVLTWQRLPGCCWCLSDMRNRWLRLLPWSEYRDIGGALGMRVLVQSHRRRASRRSVTHGNDVSSKNDSSNSNDIHPSRPGSTAPAGTMRCLGSVQECPIKRKVNPPTARQIQWLRLGAGNRRRIRGF